MGEGGRKRRHTGRLMKEAVGKEELWQQAGGRSSLGFYHRVPAEVQRSDGGVFRWQPLLHYGYVQTGGLPGSFQFEAGAAAEPSLRNAAVRRCFDSAVMTHGEVRTFPFNLGRHDRAAPPNMLLTDCLWSRR